MNVHLAGNYAELANELDYRGGNGIVATLGDNASSEYLKRLLAKSPSYNAQQVLAADRDVTASLNSVAANRRQSWLRSLLSFSIGMLALMAVLQLPAILIFSRTLGQVIYSYDVVTESGRSASRPRMLARWLIAWTAVGWTFWLVRVSTWYYLLLIPWFIGVVVAVAHPNRGWPERCTGTWLVPR